MPTISNHQGEKSRLLFAAALVALVLSVYWGSRDGAFVFDDIGSIVDNPTIRDWGHWGSIVYPPVEYGRTAGGRPILNVSLALNYAFGGLSPRGYHLTNFVIHAFSALTLFGLVRRTLLLSPWRERFGRDGSWLAFTTAALWALHPLQTESVTYVIQRAESLAGLFYLITLYAFIRYLEFPAKTLWAALSVATCFLGIATKEIVASAPLLVLLYDRTFVSLTFRTAWKTRRTLYLGLFGTWIPLIILIATGENHGGSAGFGVQGVTIASYLLTQCRAIIHYLWLAAVPHPLIFDYGTPLVLHWTDVLIQALFLLLLVSGTLVAVARRSWFGVVGAWFFLILAPSSSIVPVATQTMAEHRMYLSLAAVVVLFVVGLYCLAGRSSWIFFAAIGATFGMLTIKRNAAYANANSIWSDTVEKLPSNARAQHNLAVALADAGRLPESVEHDREALRLDPAYAEAHYDLGLASALNGKPAEAVSHYQAALQLKPRYTEAHIELAQSFLELGQIVDARREDEKALQLKPDNAKARNHLAYTFVLSGQPNEAIAQFKQTLAFHPEDADASYNLGNTYFALGRFAEAAQAFGDSLRARPDDPDTHFNLGNTFMQLGRRPEAAEEFRKTLNFRPDSLQARANLLELDPTARLPNAK